MIDFGLNRLLDNSLEITIFGIIQELITNITKHTHAKNSSIRISFYDQNLNIIVKGDGLGLDIKN